MVLKSTLGGETCLALAGNCDDVQGLWEGVEGGEEEDGRGEETHKKRKWVW